MPKFRKKPVVIEAVLLGENLGEVRDFLGGEANRNIGFSINYVSGRVTIHTLEGMMTAEPGDYLIRGVKGEFYPCKPDIFAATYDPVEADSLARPTGGK